MGMGMGMGQHSNLISFTEMLFYHFDLHLLIYEA